MRPSLLFSRCLRTESLGKAASANSSQYLEARYLCKKDFTICSYYSSDLRVQVYTRNLPFFSRHVSGGGVQTKLESSACRSVLFWIIFRWLWRPWRCLVPLLPSDPSNKHPGLDLIIGYLWISCLTPHTIFSLLALSLSLLFCVLRFVLHGGNLVFLLYKWLGF